MGRIDCNTLDLLRMNMPNSAELLLGQTLKGGWRVIERVEKPLSGTGGNFSVCYVVESEKRGRAFLKALDFSSAFRSPDPARALQAMTAAYNFERDILAKCKERQLGHVVLPIDDGSATTSGAAGDATVQYLILELADQDVRLHLEHSANVDTAWKLRSLHHIATGLMQLHSNGIAHQDLKPSNVLVFEQKTSKVGDLGRAAYDGQIGPFDKLCCAGDRSYAPPEQLYNYTLPDWKTRRFGCDLYLLGSMVVFFFTSFSTNGLLVNKLHESLRWGTWGGSFDEVLPYVRDAFGHVVTSFADSVTGEKLKGELRSVVSQLCDPDPRERGIPQSIGGISPPYSLQRYVSKFDLLARRAEIDLRR
jgi:serine/threonine protein kinase